MENPIYKVFILIGLVLCVATIIIGFTYTPIDQLFQWQDVSSFTTFIVCLTLFISIAYLLTKKTKYRPVFIFCIIIFFLALITGAVASLFVAVAIATASFIVGNFILEKCKLEHTTQISVLTGAGVYATITGILAHIPVNYVGLYAVAIAIPIILGRNMVYERVKNSLLAQTDTPTPKIFLASIIGISAYYTLTALMPELGFDSLMMHLFIPEYISTHHEWSFNVVNYAWAVMPTLGDWIFSIGNMLGGETSARLLNIGFIFIVGWILKDMVAWKQEKSDAPYWIVLLFLSTPLTFTEGSSLYIESIWASFLVAGIYALFYMDSLIKKNVILAGLLFGFACATKAITFVILPAIVIFYILKYRLQILHNIKNVCIGIGLGIATGAIPYITAWVLTRNPVFPFFNHLFQSPYFYTGYFTNPLYNTNITWDVLYQITFESRKFLEAFPVGTPGFQWLFLLIPSLIILLLYKNKQGLILASMSVMGIISVFYIQSNLRYIFPILMLLLVTIGIAYNELQENKKMRILWQISMVITILLNLIFLNAGNGFYRDVPIESLWSNSERKQYLEHRLPIRNAVQSINAINTEKKPIAVFADPLIAGLEADALYPIWHNIQFQTEVTNAQTEVEFISVLKKNNVQFIILDSNWDWKTCCMNWPAKEAWVRNISEIIVQYGSVEIRKIKEEYYFQTELLQNPEFDSLHNWTLHSGVTYIPTEKSVLVSEPSPVVQAITVAPNTYYKNSVIARCYKKTAQGRTQVNWFNQKGEFISTDIKTFACSPTWTKHTMNVISPAQAVSAHIYTSGAGPELLEFTSNSLRQ